MFFKNLWYFILRIFGINKQQSSSIDIDKNDDYNRAYEDIDHINFTSIFANKLSTLVCSDSDVSITGDKRGEYLDEVSNRLWNEAGKRIVSRVLGVGGAVIVPYVKDGVVLFNVINQNRLHINERLGNKITNATIMADTTKINDNRYYRWANYNLIDGKCEITSRVTDDEGKPVSVGWGEVDDIVITGVDRLPFAYIKSPIDNRRMNNDYGVPITYGCEEIINNITTCLKQIADEYEMKRVRLQVDKRMFKKDAQGNPIVADSLFMAGDNVTNDNMFNIFDPSIRDSSYFNRLNELFELLEKQIGTSKGILTTPETRGATATEIKASMYDTWALVTDIRKALEQAWDDFVKACDVLVNCYNLAPMGEYETAWSWDTSLIENSNETWVQYQQAQAIGVVSKAEVRQWLTGEPLDEAQEHVDEIKENEPSLASLMGNA